MDLDGFTVDGVSVGKYRDITFRCRVNVQRVAFEAKYKVSFAVAKETKHGCVVLTLCAKPYKQDLTVRVDVSPNPGPQSVNGNNPNGKTPQVRKQPCLMNTVQPVYNFNMPSPMFGYLGQLNLQKGRMLCMPYRNVYNSYLDNIATTQYNCSGNDHCQQANRVIPVRITDRVPKASNLRDGNDIKRNSLVNIPLSNTIDTRNTAVTQLYSFGHLNCRSIRNKANLVKDCCVVENKFDIFAITETWLHSIESDQISIGNVTRKGYSFKHISRQQGGGGGIGILYNNTLKVKMDSANMFLNIKSFEVMSMQISVLSQTLNIIIIYRPPNNASIELFMEEFTLLLEVYATRHGS